MFLLGADEFSELPALEGAARGAAAGSRSGSRRARATRASGSTPCSRARRAPSACRSSSSSRCRSPRASCAPGSTGGEDVREFVPAAVWELIERDGLYGRGYTESA